MTREEKLTGHSALIAGASGGIGLAAAKLLAAAGCQVHLAARNNQALDHAVEEITADYGVEAWAHPTDLSDSINAAVLALECEDVGILINAFGAWPMGDIETLDAEEWRDGFDLSVFGAINLSREVLESMNELGSGVIINVGGMIDSEDEQNQLCALTANAALKEFSDKLDRQTRLEGIRVLTFIPQAGASTDEHAAALTKLIFEKLSS